LLELAAKQHPGAEKLNGTGTHLLEWFDRTLALPAFAQLADKTRAIVAPYRAQPEASNTYWRYYPELVWTSMHGPQQWEQLAE
jgi:hypothetical protein